RSHRQQILGLALRQLAEIARAGEQQVGLRTELLVEPPVACIADGRRDAMGLAAGTGQGDAAIQAADEIAVDQRRARLMEAMRRMVEVQSPQLQVTARRRVELQKLAWHE